MDNLWCWSLPSFHLFFFYFDVYECFVYMFMCTTYMLDFLGDPKSSQSLSGTGFRIAMGCYGCSKNWTQVVWQGTILCNFWEISSASTSTMLWDGLSRLFSISRSQLAGLLHSFTSHLTTGMLKFQMSTMVVSSRVTLPHGSNNSNSHSRDTFSLTHLFSPVSSFFTWFLSIVGVSYSEIW